MDNITTKRERKYGNKFEMLKLRNQKREQSEIIKELLRQGKYRHAKQNIDNYISNYGEDCYILLECGKYFFGIYEIEESIKYYTKVVEMNAENKYYAMYELAKINRGLKDYNKSQDYLFSIINSNHPEKCHAKLELSKLYEDMGEEKIAERLLEKLIQDEEPNKDHAINLLAHLKLKHGKLKQAGKLIKMLRNYEDKSSLFYLRGLYSMCVDEHEKAIDQFNYVLNSPSKRFRLKVPHQLAYIEYKLENYEKAIEMEVNNIQKEVRPYKESIITIVESYIKLRNFDKALEYISLLKEQNYYTLNDDVASLTGKLYMMQGNFDAAIEAFNKVRPRYITLYRECVFRKACMYNKMGDYTNAQLMIEELKKISRDSEKFAGTILKMETYIKNQKGELTEIESDMSYTEKQCIKYDKEMAINHIALHKCEDPDKKYHSIFKEDVDIENLYDNIVLQLTEENYYDNNFLDCYIVKYPNVGTNKNRTVDYLKVITIPNTKKIITMYPFDNCIEKEKEISKQKQKVSRIDKFNKKYNLA